MILQLAVLSLGGMVVLQLGHYSNLIYNNIVKYLDYGEASNDIYIPGKAGKL